LNHQTILEVVSIIDFTPLWETMKKKQVSQYQLLKRGIDNKTLDSLKKNKNITLTTMEKLCKILECTPNEIVRFHD
jgi:putative transcriptional regulator